MNEDDLMPSEGAFFGGVPREPVDQVIDRKRERAETLKSAAEIKNVIEHFNERIEFRDRISALNVDLKEDPILHQKKCEVNDMLKLALTEEKQLLEELLEAHTKNK